MFAAAVYALPVLFRSKRMSSAFSIDVHFGVHFFLQYPHLSFLKYPHIFYLEKPYRSSFYLLMAFTLNTMDVVDSNTVIFLPLNTITFFTLIS